MLLTNVDFLKVYEMKFLIPLQAAVMDLVESDKQRGLAVPVWKTYEVLLRQSSPEVQLPN